MINPNNISLNISHALEFIDGHALNIPTLKILGDNGEILDGATAPELD